MVNIDKIKSLAKNQGLKMCFLSDAIGVPKTYFADLKNKHRDMPSDRITTIASILHTSVAYLRDETDDPREDTAVDPRKDEIIKLINSASDAELKQIYKIVMALREEE